MYWFNNVAFLVLCPTKLFEAQKTIQSLTPRMVSGRQFDLVHGRI